MSEQNYLAPFVRSFFEDHLVCRRNVSRNTVHSYRELAEAGQISRARMSQIMHLSDLAPEIQEELLFLPKTTTGPDRYTEKQLRQVARSIDWDWQKRQFRALGEHTANLA